MEVVDEKSLAVDGKVHSDRPSTNSELAESIERRIDFDNGCGDVMVIVEDYSKDKPDLHGLLVSSNMMSRASDVWKRMFAGEWSETRTDRPVILDYREDGYVAVTIIMNIIHLRFGDVPTVVSLAELKEIAMFTDKWMVTALIVPWVQGWLEYLSGSVDNVGCEVEWLWIAWEFGLTDVFNRVGCRLAFGGAIPAAEPSQLIRFSFGVSDAQIGFPTSNVSEEEGTFYLDNSDTLPPEVEEVITEARKAMVDRMLTELYGYFDALLDWPTYLEEACDGIPAGPEDSNNPVILSVFKDKDSSSTNRPAVYYIHGGGQIAGNRFGALDICMQYAAGIDIVFVSVEYRVAPENPALAALKDSYAGLVWTAEHATELGIDANRILLIGGSGGAPITAGCAMLCRNETKPYPAAQMLLTPMLDDRDQTVSTKQFARDGPWCGTLNRKAWDHVLGSARGKPGVTEELAYSFR
ncbi:hypothetical protein EsH8_IX_001069 [Colletotrichum jinshuiense]